MKTKVFYQTGDFDDWGNPIVKDKKNTIHVMVDGYPHPITKDWGEPLYPIKNFDFSEELELENALKLITKEVIDDLLPGEDIPLTKNYCLYHYLEDDIYVIKKIIDFESIYTVLKDKNKFVFEKI